MQLSYCNDLVGYEAKMFKEKDNGQDNNTGLMESWPDQGKSVGLPFEVVVKMADKYLAGKECIMCLEGANQMVMHEDGSAALSCESARELMGECNEVGQETFLHKHPRLDTWEGRAEIYQRTQLNTRIRESVLEMVERAAEEKDGRKECRSCWVGTGLRVEHENEKGWG